MFAVTSHPGQSPEHPVKLGIGREPALPADGAGRTIRAPAQQQLRPLDAQLPQPAHHRALGALEQAVQRPLGEVAAAGDCIGVKIRDGKVGAQEAEHAFPADEVGRPGGGAPQCALPSRQHVQAGREQPGNVLREQIRAVRVVPLGERQGPEERCCRPRSTVTVEPHREEVGRALHAGRRERLLQLNMDDDLLPRLIEAQSEWLARFVEHQRARHQLRLPARLLKHPPPPGQDRYAQVLVLVPPAGDIPAGTAPHAPAGPADSEREVPVRTAADLTAESSARCRLDPQPDAQLADDFTPVRGGLARRHRQRGPDPRACILGARPPTHGIYGRGHLDAPSTGLCRQAALPR
jgi:hypothetical protein